MSIVLTRKELYDRVWSEPMQKLSKEFGLSDVGLAKTCKRLQRSDASAWVLGEEAGGPQGAPDATAR